MLFLSVSPVLTSRLPSRFKRKLGGALVLAAADANIIQLNEKTADLFVRAAAANEEVRGRFRGSSCVMIL